MKTNIALLALLAGLWLPAQAATITVTNLNDSGPGTLRQAIADAAPGDTIDFAVTGTITLTNGELVITNNLTITGPGVANLTVSGNNSSGVFVINSGVVNLSALTVAHGNTGMSGAGIANAGVLTVSSCVISSNNAYYVYHGGGGMANGGTMTVRSCIISDNYGSNGGGIWNSGTLWISDSTIMNNQGLGGGGGIRNDWGSLGMTNTILSGNTSSWGGGLLAYASMNTIRNCTIANNTAWYGSGYGGGGIAQVAAAVVNVYGSIMAGNSAIQGAVGPDCLGNIISDDYNLIGNTSGATITGVTAHNLYGVDPLLGPLADNGGPTPTHALLPGSPAIDHGNSGGLATDQRGQPRSFNFPTYLDAADGSDIGAYELQECAQTNWLVNGSSSNLVFIVNSTNDVDDGVPGIAHCSLREAINAANANADSNSIIFAATVPGVMNGVTGTIVLTNGQLSIGTDLSITGPGATNLTISGNYSNRIFSISFSSPFVNLSGLTLANGHAIGPNTGAGESYGGCILNDGRLTILNCTLSGNVADEIGGAIYQGLGTLSIINSLLHDNQASVMGGAINNNRLAVIVGSCIFSNSAGYGGGIWNNVSIASMALTNCTVSGNIASVSGGGIGNNGQYFFADNCTICSNSAAIAGGGIALAGDYEAVFTIRNSIVAGNSAPTGPDVSGNQGLISQDYNLIQNTNDSAIIGVTTHNLYNQDPKLGPLAYLGGPTPTHPLRYDSPALNSGNSGGLTTDQRGLPRPLGTAAVSGGDGSDIGAYETDPILRMTGIAKLGNDVRLNFTTVFGKTYQIHSATNLGGTWTAVTNNLPGSGGIMQAVDTGGASQPQRYYRALSLP